VKNCSSKFIDQWREIRLRGKDHFVITRGIIGFGLCLGSLLFVLNSLLEYFRDGRTPHISKFIIDVALWTLGGMFWGKYLWRRYEKKYTELIADTNV